MFVELSKSMSSNKLFVTRRRERPGRQISPLGIERSLSITEAKLKNQVKFTNAEYVWFRNIRLRLAGWPGPVAGAGTGLSGLSAPGQQFITIYNNLDQLRAVCCKQHVILIDLCWTHDQHWLNIIQNSYKWLKITYFD